MDSARTDSPQSLSEGISRVVQAIPRGFVASYGQVAAMAGNPRAARQVVRILNLWSRSRGLPWHRVVNRDGVISLPDAAGGVEQRDLLATEGVAFGLDGRVDMKTHRWKGPLPVAGNGA